MYSQWCQYISPYRIRHSAFGCVRCAGIRATLGPSVKRAAGCGVRLPELCVLQVKGKTAAEPYTVFPLDYCSCHAFLYDVVGHGGAEQVLVRSNCSTLRVS